MRIGDVLQDQYQVFAKLGYGRSSTVWLCRDLMQETKYWVLKVHINTLGPSHKRDVFRYLEGIRSEHGGRQQIRRLETSFEITSRYGTHEVFVMEPMGMSLRTFQGLQKRGVFAQELAAMAVNQVATGLHFLHEEAQVTHTDLHSDNVLIALANDDVLAEMEENEAARPVARKVEGDRATYVSRYMMRGAGLLTISDFGQARIGLGPHTGLAMPLPYRAPEVILGMPWDNTVDLWSLGLLAWDLIEPNKMFEVYDQNSQELNDAHHLAAITALCGPPPAAFRSRSENAKKYWNDKEEWHGPVPLPPFKTLPSCTTSLKGDGMMKLASFVGCLVRWLPEGRYNAGQASFHPWIDDIRQKLQEEIGAGNV